MKAIFTILGAIVLVVGGIWFFSGSGPGGTSSPSAVTDLFGYSTTTGSANTPQEGSPQTTSGQTGSQITTPNNQVMQATLHTTKGDITIEFMGTDAPNTVANFVKLAKDGFYNGTKFHRVISGFMIQGGDPLTKDDTQMARWGTGGPGYQFGDEIHANNRNNVGTISMANSGPNTNGSQFFINTAPNNFLDSKHTVFGKVVKGMDVVQAIEKTPTGQQDRPLEAMVITSVSVE